jgi:hypothetical protein
VLRVNHKHHPNAAVECAQQFALLDEGKGCISADELRLHTAALLGVEAAHTAEGVTKQIGHKRGLVEESRTAALRVRTLDLGPQTPCRNSTHLWEVSEGLQPLEYRWQFPSRRRQVDHSIEVTRKHSREVVQQPTPCDVCHSLRIGRVDKVENLLHRGQSQQKEQRGCVKTDPDLREFLALLVTAWLTRHQDTATFAATVALNNIR